MFGLFFFSLCLSEDSLCFDSIFSKHNNNTRGRGREKQREKGVTSKCLLCLFTSFILLFLFLFVFLCQISLDYDLCPSWVLSIWCKYFQLLLMLIWFLRFQLVECWHESGKWKIVGKKFFSIFFRRLMFNITGFQCMLNVI